MRENSIVKKVQKSWKKHMQEKKEEGKTPDAGPAPGNTEPQPAAEEIDVS